MNVNANADVDVLEEIIERIKEHRRFAISTHISPEGDAVGSALALRLILRRLGKEALVVMQDPVPYNLTFLKGAEGIKPPTDPALEQLAPELWFIVDCANLDRVGEGVRRLIEDSGKPIVNIDHHLHNPEFGELNYVRQTAATAQLIWELAKRLHVLDPEITTCLYAGIVADTSAFRNDNTDAQVLREAAELLDHGARAREVAVNLFERRTLGETRLLGYALLNAKLADGIFWISFPLEIFAELGAAPHETEPVVNELRKLDGVEVAVLFKELENNKVKLSLRSKGRLDVSAVARRFGGGGHEKAAGALIPGELKQVEEVVLAELRRRLDALHAGVA